MRKPIRHRRQSPLFQFFAGFIYFHSVYCTLQAKIFDCLLLKYHNQSTTEKRLQNLFSASYHFSPKKKVVVWKNRENRSVNWFSGDTFNNKKRDLSIIFYRRMHLLPKTAWYTLFSSVMTMKDDVKALWQASETSSFSWSSETSMAKVCTLEYSIDSSENCVIRKMACEVAY